MFLQRSVPGMAVAAPKRPLSLRSGLCRILGGIAAVAAAATLIAQHAATGRESEGPPLPFQAGKVSVEVYYEVLCPDSRHFVLRQLYPAWRKVPEIMDVRWKPYGKARVRESDCAPAASDPPLLPQHRGGAAGWEFTCQHGPTECQGNMVHACAAKHVANASALVEYVRCMMEDAREPLQVGRRCAGDHGVDWDAVRRCVAGGEGREALAAVGDDTHSLRPKVSFIPTIRLNGSQDGQRLILKNFLKELCRLYEGELPSNCRTLL